MFVEEYLRSLSASNLQDDDQHHRTNALVAAALADLGGSGSVLGSMLMRVKYADGVPRKTFESGSHNLAALLRAWTEIVTRKGLDRGWMKIKAEWDIKAAHGMYAKIARMSLAHWLGGECQVCHGTKYIESRSCSHCSGTGLEPIAGGALEVERTKDMVSELEGLCQAHGARAAAKMRKAA